MEETKERRTVRVVILSVFVLILIVSQVALGQEYEPEQQSRARYQTRAEPRYEPRAQTRAEIEPYCTISRSRAISRYSNGRYVMRHKRNGTTQCACGRYHYESATCYKSRQKIRAAERRKYNLARFSTAKYASK